MKTFYIQNKSHWDSMIYEWNASHGPVCEYISAKKWEQRFVKEFYKKTYFEDLTGAEIVEWLNEINETLKQERENDTQK